MDFIHVAYCKPTVIYENFISQFNKDLQSSFMLTNIFNKDIEYLEKYISETFILENGY